MLPPLPPKKNQQQKKNIMKEIINSAILIISRLSINTFKGKGIQALNSSSKTIITD